MSRLGLRRDERLTITAGKVIREIMASVGFDPQIAQIFADCLLFGICENLRNLWTVSRIDSIRLPIIARFEEVQLIYVDSENLFAIRRQQSVVGAKSDNRLAIFSFNAVEYAVA